MLDGIRELFACNRWANPRKPDAVSALSDEELNREVGGSFGSLQPTLIHAIGAEWVTDGRLRCFLRQLGAEPVNTDLVRFYREASDAA